LATGAITFPAPESEKVIGWNTAGTALENKIAIDDDVAAASDGFVEGWAGVTRTGGSGCGQVDIYTDAAADPTTIRNSVVVGWAAAGTPGSTAGWCVPVKKGHYWKAVKTNLDGSTPRIDTFACYWIPTGS